MDVFALYRRHSGAMRKHRTRNLEIPGSRWRAPRNDDDGVNLPDGQIT